MEIRHVHARRDRAGFLGVNGQVVHIIDLERVAGGNAYQWGNTLPLVGEGVPSADIESRMQRKRSNVILRSDFGRRGKGNLGFSSDPFRHDRKSSDTTPIAQTHSNYPSLFKAPGLNQEKSADGSLTKRDLVAIRSAGTKRC